MIGSLRETGRGPLAKAAFALAAFAVLAAAILGRPEKRLNDFDQSFYLTIAYDMTRHGVFSGGVFDQADSTRAAPPPGMFFVPGYPALVAAAMWLDPRFDRAVACHVLANEGHRSLEGCEFYARPIHLAHAALLAGAALAIAASAQLLFGGFGVFLLAGTLATAGFAAEADLFSFVMTESLGVALFSFAALALVRTLRTGRGRDAALTGALLGLLILSRPSFQALLVLYPLALAIGLRWLAPPRRPAAVILAAVVAFLVGAAVVVGPWVARNAVVIGKAGLSAEYGSAAIIERLAYNDMTLREGLLAGPYCLPGVGPALVSRLAGPDAMARFEWDHPGSFFQTGRASRDALVKANTRLDPVMGEVLRAEYEKHGLRHLLTTIPLAWCGLWVAQWWGLLLVPVFLAACCLAFRRAPLFLAYAVPALAMVGLHAAVANHYPRYNLMLIGPVAAGTAWLLTMLWTAARYRRTATGAKQAS